MINLKNKLHKAVVLCMYIIPIVVFSQNKIKEKGEVKTISNSNVIFSQNKIKGKVKDEVGAVPYANVVLMNGKDEIIAGSVTSEDGSFEIEANKGVYVLSITYVGYKVYKQQIELLENMELQPIFLEEEKTELGEVTVVAKRKLIRRKTDRLVYNIESNIAAAGGDALDALKIAPGVTVNGSNVSIIGKSNMRVMIDGRIIQLSGEALMSFISSIPTDDIKEIEIITNPPAKYEAEGNSGLINIIYKKGRKNSWNNRTSLTYFQSFLPRFTLRNNFTYQKDKLSLILSLSGTKGNTIIDREGKIFYSSGSWVISRRDKWNNENLSGRLMLDYDVSKNSTIGFQYLGNLSNPDPSQTTFSKTKIFNNAMVVDSLLNNKGRSKQQKYNHSLNVHFKTKIDEKGKNLSTDLDYFTYNSDNDRNVNTKSYTNDGDFLNNIFSNKNVSNQKIENFSVKLDMEYPLKAFNLSYGVKASFTKSEYKTDNFNTLSGTPELIVNDSDDFEYTENNQAVYINGSKKFNEKWNGQLGLRMENTQTKGISNVLNQTNTNDYLRVFPTLYISYKMNEKNNFSFNYGRRISRPLYYQLNPARTYISNVNFIEGNPQLKPSFTDNLEFIHTYKGNWITTLFFSVENDGFGEIADIDDTTNEQFFKHQNFYTHYNYGISEYYTFDKLSWWESQNSVYLIGNKTNLSISEGIIAKPQNGFRFYGSTNNTFTLNSKRTIKAQINYWYSSAFKNNLFEYSESHELDLALKFNISKNSWQLSMGVYDIFNTSPRKSTSFTNNIKQTQKMFPSNRNFRATLTYNFGNKKVRVNQRNFGNEEEKGRVGN
ncbi:TonB-dependent receptor [Rhodobacteraceae bacterium 4F10]|nr:TonB-dependent receptor [Rhodobacteraceae bacterium 4F10]